MRGLVAATCLALFGCGARVIEADKLTLGADCTAGGACRAPLVCGDDGACVPPADVPLAGYCVISLDCAPGLYCDAGNCAEAGGAAAGDVCATTRECTRGLRCAYGGLGGVCAEPGGQYLGWECATSDECLAGLVCDPQGGECAPRFAPPLGEGCAGDFECLPRLGVTCDRSRPVDGKPGTCGGRGPDGQPVPAWRTSCGDGDALDGGFRVLFSVAGATPAADYFSLPYPNDARLASGHLDLSGFPRPPDEAAPSDVFARYLAASAADPGFGPSQAVFMRFSGPPRFCTACAAADGACLSSCMGAAERAPSVYVADITREAHGFSARPFGSILFQWSATTANSPYLCGPSLSVWPLPKTPWRPGHTYFVFVHRRVQGRDGDRAVAQRSDADFAAMLAPTEPEDPRLRAAYGAHQILRDWLASRPEWPPGDVDFGPIEVADLGGGTVFTVREPKARMLAIADVVAAARAPAVRDVFVCTSSFTVEGCVDPGAAAFYEVRGRLDLTVFQRGRAPHLDGGGDIVVDAAGVPEGQALVPASFALSVPHGTPPPRGWPVVLFAHDVDADYREALTGELAERLAAVDVGGQSPGLAVLSFEQVAEGARNNGAAQASSLLFAALERPAAARGNVLQAAADLLAVRKAVGDLSDAVAATSALAGVHLDDTAVAFVGHGQGARAGVLAMAYADGTPVAVLAGVGGGLVEEWMLQSAPQATRWLWSLALGDPSLLGVGLSEAKLLAQGRAHPALSLVQSYLDDVDALTYAPFVSWQDVGRGARKSVLELVGVGDAVTPSLTALSLAEQLGVAYLDDAGSELVPASSLATPPISANLGGQTRVASIHAPAEGGDGHDVIFDEASGAPARLRGFLSSWQLDTNPVVR